jgi:hypothetical protein
MRTSRFALIASGVTAAGMLAACASNVPLYGPRASTSGYPAPAPATAPATAPVSPEYGRVTGMEFYQGGTAGATTSPTYRVSIQTDQGAIRVYDVPTTGDLRVGDRVRIENGVISRS